MPIHQPHTAKAMVFTCIDERLEPAVTALITSQPGGAFHAALAGGGAAFNALPERDVAIKQIVAAYKINRIQTVFVQSHTNCGAYGLAGITFASPGAETERLYTDLQAAKTLIEAALADAGAKPGEVTVNIQVIDPSGTPVPQTMVA